MPTIHALAGVSGAGKTYERTHNPLLQDLPTIDVADYYEQYPRHRPAAKPGPTWRWT